MRFLIAILMAVALSACATTAPVSIQAADTSSHIVGAATIAKWGTWEMDLAPVYTRLEMQTLRANRLLLDGQMDRLTAQRIHDLAVQGRADLARSRRGDMITPTDAQRAALADAKLIADQIGVLLEDYAK